MVNRLKLRINQITGDNRYIAHEITVNNLIGGVEVTINFYRSHGNYAYQYIEVWVVKDADETNYLDDDKVAYRVKVSVSKNYTKTLSYFGRRFRWFRRW